MNVLPMDRVREALELAVEEQWEQRTQPMPAPDDPPPSPPPAARKPEVVGPDAAVKAKAAADEPASASRAARPNGAAMTVPGPPSAQNLAALLSNRLVAADVSNPQREAYCLLQTAVARRMAEQEFHSLGVTSPRTGRGKTLTAINLAISLACEGRRQVLLVDLNLRQPKVYECFDRQPSVGVEGCLFGGIRLEDACFEVPIGGLLVLPARGGSQNIPQVFRSENLRMLLAATRDRYPDHLMIADLPPLSEPREDARVFQSLMDAMLLVVDEQVTKESDLRRALEALNKSTLIGSVLNNSRSS